MLIFCVKAGKHLRANKMEETRNTIKKNYVKYIISKLHAHPLSWRARLFKLGHLWAMK